MDLIELRAIIEAERSAALGEGTYSGAAKAKDEDLASQRARNMDYYLGDMRTDMPAPEGRSAVVSTDVSDTVDGILPDLMDIFTGTDEVVSFDPVGPEDEEAAKQEGDYLSYVFYKQNDGFKVLHTMMKDALIQKNGICKFWWEETEESERETYRALPDDAFALLMADATIELLEHTATPDPMTGETLHDAVVVKSKKYGCVKVMAVPPEEFVIAKDARDIAKSRYCAHKVKRTQSALIEMGYPRSVIESIPDGDTTETYEYQSRSTVGDEDEARDATQGANRAMRMIEVWEHYIRVDYDGDGVAELRKVTQAGAKILDNEEFDRMPFASITPILMSHRFTGRALADLVIEIQKVNTALDRAGLDSIYFSNNQRAVISEDQASENTLDDWLNNRPGSPIRVRGNASTAVVPLVSQPMIQHILPVREFWDMKRETRTGVQRFGATPDGNSLNPFNRTATGANIVATAGQKRIRLIARVFAEGIKEMFLGMHALILKHGKDARRVKLGNRWVTVDPRQWKTRKDMTTRVGLGTGSRDQLQAQLMNILGIQIEGIKMQGGLAGPLFNADNVAHTVKKLVENSGFNDADPFVMEPPPEASQPQPPPPDPKMVEAQGRLQIEGAKLEFEKVKTAEELKLKQFEIASNIRLKEVELGAEMALAKEKVALDGQIAVGKINTDAEVRREEVKGKTQLERDKWAAEKSPGPDLFGEMKALADELRGDLTKLSQRIDETAAMAQRPRKSTLVRDPKTGRASHAIHEVM